MSEHVSHASEARALLAQAEQYRSEDFPIQTGERKADILAAAQVHATLALAEMVERATVPRMFYVGDAHITEAGA